MFYQFPEIRNISDVLPAIEGSPEFIVADRGNYTIINYVVSTPDTFPPVTDLHSAIRRECRGLIFRNSDGAIIRRPLNKFFNINQIAETQANLIDLSHPHHILEKLDGSMIAPYNTENKVIFGTKMGDTDVATFAQDFVKTRPQYMDAFHTADANGWTLVFEFCSRKQRIVIDHPEDQMILTAIRNIKTGEYLDYYEMVGFGAYHEIPVVKTFPVNNHTNIDDIMAFILAQEGSEGVVIRFANGMQVKAKSDWYCAIHGAKEAITEEKNVVRMIIDEVMDDTKALLLQDDRDNLDRYERDFWKRVRSYSNVMLDLVLNNINTYSTKKDYALGRAQKDDDYVRVTTFKVFDTEELSTVTMMGHVVDRFIRPNLNNRTKFGVMKQKIFPNQRLYL